MKNFLAETQITLELNGKNCDDVRFVSDGNAAYAWEEFAEIANFEYDSCFGLVRINLDLRIVGDDWWLERLEYDGSEWWSFQTMPKALSGDKKRIILEESERSRW